MVDAAAGLAFVLGGALMNVGAVSLARDHRRSVDRARELLGDSTAAVVLDTPPDMLALLDQIP